MLCATACEFAGVGRVIFIAPDLLGDGNDEDPGRIEPEWVVAANLLFMSEVAADSGLSSPMIICAWPREPEINDLMQIVGDKAFRQAAVRDSLMSARPGIEVGTGNVASEAGAMGSVGGSGSNADTAG